MPLNQRIKEYALKADRIISFNNLEKFFIQRTYVDIPLLHFLQRFPKVKFFLTNFPNNLKLFRDTASSSARYRVKISATNR